MLADIRRILSPAGLLVVALPNVLNYRDRLNFVLGNFDYTETGVMDQTHVHFYTYRTGQELLEMNGFQVVSASAQGAFPLWKLRKLLPKTTVGNLDTLACKSYPGLFALQNVYTAQIAPTQGGSSSR